MGQGANANDDSDDISGISNTWDRVEARDGDLEEVEDEYYGRDVDSEELNKAANEFEYESVAKSNTEVSHSSSKEHSKGDKKINVKFNINKSGSEPSKTSSLTSKADDSNINNQPSDVEFERVEITPHTQHEETLQQRHERTHQSTQDETSSVNEDQPIVTKPRESPSSRIHDIDMRSNEVPDEYEHEDLVTREVKFQTKHSERVPLTEPEIIPVKIDIKHPIEQVVEEPKSIARQKFPVYQPAASNKSSLLVMSDESGSESSSEEHKEHFVITPDEVNDYIITAAFIFGCIVGLVCLGIIIVKVIMWCFCNPKSGYQEFENEKITPVNSNKIRSMSHMSSATQDLEKFRKNELKGELDPHIFYKNEFSKENTGNHRALDLKLDFDNQTEENERQLQLEAQNQSQIRKLKFDYDLSSRNSNEFSDKPDISIDNSSQI